MLCDDEYAFDGVDHDHDDFDYHDQDYQKALFNTMITIMVEMQEARNLGKELCKRYVF